MAEKIGARVRSKAKKGNPKALIIPSDIKPLFSDGMIIQYASEAFLLNFLKVLHPFIDGTEASETRCVAQVVITPSQMAENLKVMVGHFVGFANSQDAEIRDVLLEKAGLTKFGENLEP